MKRFSWLLVFVVLFAGLATWLIASERPISEYVERGLTPGRLVAVAFDSSAVCRTTAASAVLAIIDEQILRILSCTINTDTVSADSAFTFLFSCPAGVTTTVNGAMVTARTAPVVDSLGTKAACLFLIMYDATDSSRHFLDKQYLDTGRVANNFFSNYKSAALTFDSTTYSRLSEGDALWACYFTDSGNIAINDLAITFDLVFDEP